LQLRRYNEEYERRKKSFPSSNATETNYFYFDFIIDENNRYISQLRGTMIIFNIYSAFKSVSSTMISVSYLEQKSTKSKL